MLRTRTRRAFSLIELMVVVAILGILTTMMLTGVQKAREAADRAVCQNNLKQIGLAMHLYADVNGGFPPRRNNGGATRSWAVQILPFIEENAIVSQYNYGVAWSDTSTSPVNNLQLSQTVIQTYLCPSTPMSPASRIFGAKGTGPQGAASDYAVFNSYQTSKWVPAGDKNWTSSNEMQALIDSVVNPLASITDGLSNTAMVVEQAGQPNSYVLGQSVGYSQWGPWANNLCFALYIFGSDGKTKDGAGDPCVINCSNQQGVYAFHPGGANMVFADGSVHFITDGIPPYTLLSLTTAWGNESIDQSYLP